MEIHSEDFELHTVRRVDRHGDSDMPISVAFCCERCKIRSEKHVNWVQILGVRSVDDS
jgi:hypothetical protein